MNTEYTKKFLNSTFIDIYVQLSDGEVMNDPSFNISNFNLTWEMESFIGSQLRITMNFTNGLYISKGQQFDNIVFHIINETDIFRDTEGKYLSAS